MHSDVRARCAIAREEVAVPAFSAEAIRARAHLRSQRRSRRRSFVAAIVAGFSLVAVAGAAITQQTHLRFTQSGGMVIQTGAKSGSRPIHGNAEIRAAAQRLDFPAVLPAGLPAGTEPVRLYTAGRSLMAITYNLPGAQRRSHHLLWIFLANPQTLANLAAPARYRLRTAGAVREAHWRNGAEEVIVVSNGLLPEELASIERAMKRGSAVSPR